MGDELVPPFSFGSARAPEAAGARGGSVAVQWTTALQVAGVPSDTAIALSARLNARQLTPTHVLHHLTLAEVADLGLAQDAFLLERLRMAAAEHLRFGSSSSGGAGAGAGAVPHGGSAGALGAGLGIPPPPGGVPQAFSNDLMLFGSAAGVLPELPFGGLGSNGSSGSSGGLRFDSLSMLPGISELMSVPHPIPVPADGYSNIVASAAVAPPPPMPISVKQEPRTAAAAAPPVVVLSDEFVPDSHASAKKRKQGGGGGGGAATASEIDESGGDSGGSLGGNESKHVQLIEEPSDAILSARSTHTYRVSVYRQRVLELKIYMEDENGVALPDFVTVENQTAHESSDMYLLVTLKLRLKPDRLQLCNVVFELLVESLDAPGTATTRRVRSRGCIVCSHITRQREAAQRKLDSWNEAQSLTHLRSRILEKYQSYRFARQLSEDGMIYLLCVALQCSRDELAIAASRSKDAARLRDFEKWFSRCLKTIDHVRPYWDNGCVYGFLSRPHAEQLVGEHSNGVAIIRLSESVPRRWRSRARPPTASSRTSSWSTPPAPTAPVLSSRCRSLAATCSA